MRGEGKGRERGRLSARWVRVSVGVLAVALTLFAAALLLMLHWHVHRQTDALLLAMARVEAAHLRDEDWLARLGSYGGVGLPLQGEAAQAVVALLDERCGLVNTQAAASISPNRGWCEGLAAGAHAHFDIDDPRFTPLRAVRLAAVGPDGGAFTLVVGIDHDRIDGSVWQAARLTVPLWALVLLGFGWIARAMSRWLTRDLEGLSQGCAALDVAQAVTPDAPEAPFSVSDGAPQELATLRDTLNGLIQRLRAEVEGQSHFIAEAAHELRTPLTALQGELELALRRERTPEAYRDALGSALSDARRLSRLSDHLLEAAQTRAQPLPLVCAPLAPLVDAALGRLSRQVEAQGVEVLWAGGEGAGGEGARGWLHPLTTARALDNLLQNALTHGSPRRLWLRQGVEGPWLTLWVEDDGPGLPPAVRERLFSPFVRADAASSETRGHGLGLYITQQLMVRQGGDLSLHAPEAEAKGARWRLRWRAG